MVLKMIYTNKGKICTSHEGLMIGNGNFGALIYEPECYYNKEEAI